MMKALKIAGYGALFLAVMAACSTEKNTFINRNYHSLTAHYNGYFNANELINQSMTTYRNSRQEDYYELLPIDPVPNEEEVIGMYPAIDTAIEKCKKVIRNHSMPSNDRPARKREEHNRWIDENWTTIGIASFYRRDYEGAMKSFLFVRKFYDNDPSLYIGELWMAKTNMATGNYTDAKFNLDNLDQAILDEEERKGEKPTKRRKGRRKKKDEKIAKFPKRIRFDLDKAKAQLALHNGDKQNAILFLEESLKHAGFGRSAEKARVHFILGQLHEEAGNNSEAVRHYNRVIKGNAPYEMSFNARLKRTFLGEGDKVKKRLKKMLKDAKNAEFKDQIYWALADLELREGNEEEGVKYLTACAFYSTKNTRQKGMAYERMGDMRFEKRDYVRAQKYYDSCASVINDTYPNAEAIRNKATKLSDLVVAVETAQYEDSVQRIAAMPDNDREKYLKDLIKQIKKEEQARKEREAARLRELQQNEALFDNGGGGSKWYWNNGKAREEGYQEFRKLWGARENEDDWRRSNKAFNGGFEALDGENPGDSLIVQEDSLTVESLAVNLPFGDSALAASNERLLKAYYDAGVIYKDQLNEDKMASKQFNNVLERNIEDPHNILSAYQLYKMNEASNPTEATIHKNYILNNYPNSGYAGYLRDPDYFIKKKERDALAEQEYVKVMDRYSRGIYYPVITKANKVIAEEPENIFRPKYMLLKAMCLGQIKEQKDTLIPVLQQVVEEYPETPESVRAQEMIDIIKNGYSENIEVDFSNKSPYRYDDRQKLRVMVFLDEGTSATSAKTRIIDFHREFFSRERLKVDSKVFGKSSVVLIDEFETESAAAKYITTYKRTRKYLLNLQNAKIMMVTKDNLKVLLQKQSLAEYQKFYDEYY